MEAWVDTYYNEEVAALRNSQEENWDLDFDMHN
jgi:hypothetical protein